MDDPSAPPSDDVAPPADPTADTLGDGSDAAAAGGPTDGGETTGGSVAIQPIFLGNLHPSYSHDEIINIFHKPVVPPGKEDEGFKPVLVDRLDQKRGYCFVFFKDAKVPEDKDNAQRFVAAINGMEVEGISASLRVEVARGDGRIKKKEEDRKKSIQPSETLFVVNFNEQNTKYEDLKMLFEPYGEVIRIDMKRNYAFIQFSSVEEATRAKEVTDGGRLESNVLTVEFVANKRGGRGGGGGGGRGGGYRRDDRGGFRGGRNFDRYDRPAPDRYDRNDDRGGGGGRGRYNDDRYDDRRRDDRGGDRYEGRGGGGGGYRGRSPSPQRGGYRGRSRSRSRSPPRYRDDRGGGRDDRGGGGYRGRSPSPRGRGGYDDRDRYDDRGGSRGYDDRDRDRYDDRGRDDRGYRY